MKAVVVNAYHPPGNKTQAEAEFRVLVNSVKQFHPSCNVVALGDFNHTPERVRNLACQVNLTLMLPPAADWFTREQGRQRSTLDFFLSNVLGHNQRHLAWPTLSDHWTYQAAISSGRSA